MVGTVYRLILLLLFLTTGGTLQAQSAGSAVAGITAEDLRRHIAVIADDSMQGRDTPSPGLERAAAYVAAEFRRLGLRPAGDSGGYFQRFGVSRWVVDTANSRVEFRAGGEAAGLGIGTEARYVAGGFPATMVRGPVVALVGSPDSALPRLEGLRDRIVLWVLDYSRPLPADIEQRVKSVARVGPAAVLLLSNRDSATFALRLAAAGAPRLTRDWAPDDEGPPIVELPEAGLQELLARAVVSPAAFRSKASPGILPLPKLDVRLRLARRYLLRGNPPNLVGLLPGTDPSLRHEYVVISAHLDHIGITPGRADSINNGADDNASGVAALLELAQAFATPGARPARSLLFLAPAGEEKGLWGSDWFLRRPTVPLPAIVADINLDLVGRNWPDSVIAVGPELSSLGEVLQRVTAAHLELRMTPIADRWPEERIFYRSDHYNFARRGVPVLFFTSGTHPDYHQPTDSPDRIDVEKESRLARLLFYLAEAVANAPARPRWRPESYRRIVDRD